MKSKVLIGRRSKTDEGTAAGGGGITYTYGILKLVKSMLENSKSKEQTDGDHHQYDAHAQTANSCPTTHLDAMIYEYGIKFIYST